MRYIHLFLILNLLVCYAGVCGDRAFAASPSNIAEGSCHSEDHEMTGENEKTSDLTSHGNNDSLGSPCCLDYLNGSSADNYSNTAFTLVKVLPVIEFYTNTITGSSLDPDQIFTGHDPPDLQVIYSTFLL